MRMIDHVRLTAGPSWRPAKVFLQSRVAPEPELRDALFDPEIRDRAGFHRHRLAARAPRSSRSGGAKLPACDRQGMERQLRQTAPVRSFVQTLRQLAGTLAEGRSRRISRPWPRSRACRCARCSGIWPGTGSATPTWSIKHATRPPPACSTECRYPHHRCCDGAELHGLRQFHPRLQALGRRHAARISPQPTGAVTGDPRRGRVRVAPSQEINGDPTTMAGGLPYKSFAS